MMSAETADPPVAPPEARSEWRMHWPLVLAALAGMALTSVPATSIGLFMEPLGREFGWSRASIASGLTIYAFFAVPVLPLVGSLLDRWGSRRIAIPGIVGSTLLFISFGLIGASLIQWWLLWSVLAFVEAAIKAPVWTMAVSKAFVAGRGLALAVTLCGSALAQMLVPVMTQWLISHRGWRSAYLWLGASWGILVLILVVLFFFDVRDRRQPSVAQAALATKPPVPGLSFGEAVRNPPLVRIALAIMVMTFMTSALMVHLVPLLTERGFPRSTAALITGSVGVFSLVGKLLSGWLLDRIPGTRIAAPSLALPALSCLVLLNTSAPAFAIVAVGVLGYVTGAQLQLCTYLTSRYGGLRHFGKIFGLMTSLMTLGVGLGPVIAGLIYDRTGSYSLVLAAGVPAGLLCAALLTRLGPYPQWQQPAAT